ncbi:MAG: FG-GAP repeat domain-containing protein [Desulfovibrio sp.]|nr:VCBS repeat-containing protein [Mailhella sp.]
MSRRFMPLFWAFTLVFALVHAPAFAASYLVAPFKVSGGQGQSYLSQAIPSMLTSRLYKQGSFEPAARQDAALKDKAPASREAASAMAKKYGADYVVWGSVTVMGDQASIDVSALSPKGKLWKRAESGPVNALIGSVQGVADGINAEVFGRTDVAARPAARTGGGASAGSAFVINDTAAGKQSETYLNPSLRYQGRESSSAQLRSQMLDYECQSMDVGDIDGDGKNEILLLGKHYLYAYRWQDGNRLAQIGQHRLPSAVIPVNVRVFRSGRMPYVAVSCYDEEERSARSQVLQFAGGKFNVVVPHARRYLNVVALPPMFGPMLVGQDSDRSKTVSGPVFEMYLEGGKLVRGGNITGLPKGANLFNFAWIPPDRGKKGSHVAMISDAETLVTFDAGGKRLAATQETYSGSSVYIIGDRGLGSLESPDPTNQVLYYVPMRMPVVDLDRDGKFELIVNKPVTVTGKLFTNFRTYPQGEIHAMAWNGLGMELLWKTRRIKGTVCDVAVTDIDSNGKMDLVVAVNSYAGLGAGIKTRCGVIVYPLDTTMVSGKPNYSE